MSATAHSARAEDLQEVWRPIHQTGENKADLLPSRELVDGYVAGCEPMQAEPTQHRTSLSLSRTGVAARFEEVGDS
jgi:hypothetical protein